MDVYPDNTLANYKVKLGRPIQLTGHYEVGLVEIIYPNKSLNVQKNEAGIVIKTEKRETINIPRLPVNKAGKKPKSAKARCNSRRQEEG